MEQVIRSLNEHRDIIIFPHVNMDGDALGSVLGLYFALQQKGKNVQIMVEEEVPLHLKFFPGSCKVCVFERSDLERVKTPFLGVAVDTADIERLGARKSLFEKAIFTLNIDHHPTNTLYAEVNLIKSHRAASGEIIYELLKELDCSYTNEIATCVYGAISSDTGGFRFSNTSAETHRMAAELLELGAEANLVSMNLFESVSRNRYQMMADVIQSTQFFCEGKIALILLTQEMIAQYGASDDEVSGFAGLGRTIRGVEVAIFIREKKEHDYKVSLRSRESVDLTQIVVKFGGGGHKRAAGLVYQGAVETLIEDLVKEFSEIL